MLNWREVPFIRILIPCLLGISSGIYFDTSFPFGNYFVFGLFFFLIYVSLIKVKFSIAWINGLLISSFIFLFAFQLTYYHNDLNLKDHFRKNISKENLLIGVVENAPSGNDRFIQVNLNIQHIGKDISSLESASGTVMLRFRNDTINQLISYGDVLAVKTTIKRVAPNLNPEAFDFQKYLNYKNIHYQGFASSESWTKLDSNSLNPVLAFAYSTRKNLINILRENIKSKNEFGVASALILGYKKELTEDLKKAYSQTGAMHVLAVSGLHVGLIWAILAFFLNWIKWRSASWRWIKTGITISGLWSFALLTGAAPSVLRAATMFSFLLVGKALNRNTNIYNTLAASAFCLLLFNPYLLMEVGFQLSYLAVVGIVYFYQKIYNLWYIENKLGDYLLKLTAVALAAQTLTFPLTMYYFHQFPVYFWLSGLVVVPFAFLVLGVGLTLLLIDGLFPFLSPLITKLLFVIIWLMNAFIGLVEQLPGALIEKIWLEPSTFILLFITILCVILAINMRSTKWLIFGLICLLGISALHVFSTYKKQNQRAIVFYHLPQKSYIEFIRGRQAIALSDPEIQERTLQFANQNFHMKHGIRQVEPVYFGLNKTLNDTWFLENDFVQFFNKKIAFVDKLPQNPLPEKIKVDFIVFRKWAISSVDQVKQVFDFEKIVFDGALNKKRLIELKGQCRLLNVPFYDVNQEGALVLDL